MNNRVWNDSFNFFSFSFIFSFTDRNSKVDLLC